MTDDLHGLAAPYALNALDDLERRAFEKHLVTCATCQIEVDEYRTVAGSLADSVAVTPPPSLKDKVMAELERTPQMPGPATQTESSEPRFSRRNVLIAAAALVLLGAVGVGLGTLPGNDAPSVDEIVAAADARATDLAAVSGDQDGNIRIVWSDERDQVAVIGSQLGDPGVGMAYALWFVLDDGVVPAGLFRPDGGDVTTVLDVDDIDATGWGITIEPEGGSPQPTTDVLFTGNI